MSVYDILVILCVILTKEMHLLPLAPIGFYCLGGFLTELTVKVKSLRFGDGSELCKISSYGKTEEKLNHNLAVFFNEETWDFYRV